MGSRLPAAWASKEQGAMDFELTDKVKLLRVELIRFSKLSSVKSKPVAIRMEKLW